MYGMRFRTALRTSLSVLLLVLLVQPLCAQKEAPVKGQVGWIRQAGWAEIGSDGRRSGYIFELLDKMAEDGRLEFEYREASSRKELEELIAGGKVDLFIEDTVSSNTEGMTTLPGSIGRAGILLLCSRPGDERFSADDFAALDGKTLALKDKSSVKRNIGNFERENAFTTKKRYYDSADAVRKALLSGSVDLAVLSNYDDTAGLVIQAKFGLAERHIAVSDRRPDLKEALYREIERVLLEDPLYLHTLTLKYNDSQNTGTMAFSKKEMDFIQNAPPIDIYIRDDLPMYNLGQNGTFTGYFPTMLGQISKDTGLTFTIRGYTDTDKLADDFKVRMDPFALCVLPRGDSKLADGSLKCTGTATSFTLLLMVKKGHKQDIRTVAYNRDSHVRDLVAEYGYTGIEYEDGTAALNAVLKDEADSALVENYIGQILLNVRKYRKALTVRFDPIITCDLVFAAMADTDDTLLTIMNKSLMNLSKDDLWSYTRASSSIDYWGFSLVGFLLDNWYVLVLVLLVFVAGIGIIVLQHRFNRRLEASNRNKDVFLADMSHDFRTPLTAISGFAYLGKTENDPRYYPEIITSAAYMQELVNDILNIRQYSEGK